MATRAEATGEEERAVVLYPSKGMGHLPPMVELAKLLVCRGFPVQILVLDPPHATGSSDAFLSRVSAAHPSISFHLLPQVPHSHLRSRDRVAMAFELVRLTNPALLRHLRSSPPPLALVLDAFCMPAVDVAREIRLPTYLFCTTGAGYLSALLHLPSVHAAVTGSFRDLGESPIRFPGVPPAPASHLPAPLQDREGEAYGELLCRSRRAADLDGIVVNTFEALEPAAIRAIRGGLCLPQGARTPPIYCVGPVTSSADGEVDDETGCLGWLDAQPPASVVFLCFGSMGRFSAEQLKEIATGLEGSGYRFLWVVRSPPGEPDLDLDLDLEGGLLPAGFLRRTGGRGMVVRSWAPQTAVLGHGAVGGFVTHLGWNSVLEAVVAGVPMVGWPLYAEQRMNKVFVVDCLDLAGVMEGYDKDLVTAAEVEARVRWLMESEEGRALRARAAAAKEGAADALREGGSSHAAMDELVRVLKAEHPPFNE